MHPCASVPGELTVKGKGEKTVRGLPEYHLNLNFGPARADKSIVGVNQPIAYQKKHQY